MLVRDMLRIEVSAKIVLSIIVFSFLLTVDLGASVSYFVLALTGSYLVISMLGLWKLLSEKKELQSI